MTDPRAPADGLTTTAFVVLGVLAFGRPLWGYQVHQWAQNTRYFHPAPAHSHVYRELRRLAPDSAW